MKLIVKPENILEAIVQTRKELSPFLLTMLGMGVSQTIVTKVIINDVFHPGDRGKLTSPISLFSLIYYVTCGGRIWGQPTIVDWLTKIRFTNLRTSKQRLGLLVAGEKP